MKEKVLKINKKDYNIAKSLSDRDFGTLVRALCECAYFGIDASPKDKILKVYYDNFKENIVYLSIIKSIVSSLFNGKVAELDGQPLPKRTFESGAYRFTPSYLEGYEARAFKELGDK